MGRSLLEKFKESLLSVLPITALVVIISLTMAKTDGYTVGLFLIGAVLLIFGMGLFTLGADVAMMPMGGAIGFPKQRKAVFRSCLR